jgi:hypothetical protein
MKVKKLRCDRMQKIAMSKNNSGNGARGSDTKNARYSVENSLCNGDVAYGAE